MVTRIIKSLSFQKIKWEMALGKPTASIVESILIEVHHYRTHRLGPNNQRIWTLL